MMNGKCRSVHVDSRTSESAVSNFYVEFSSELGIWVEHEDKMFIGVLSIDGVGEMLTKKPSNPINLWSCGILILLRRNAWYK